MKRAYAIPFEFYAPTSTGVRTLTFPGRGPVQGVIMSWTYAQDGALDNTGAAFGMCLMGRTNVRSMVTVSRDGQNPTVCFKEASNSRVVQTIRLAGGISLHRAVQVSAASWPADGFSMDFISVDSRVFKIHGIALCGEDVKCMVTEVTTPTGADNDSTPVELSTWEPLNFVGMFNHGTGFDNSQLQEFALSVGLCEVDNQALPKQWSINMQEANGDTTPGKPQLLLDTASMVRKLTTIPVSAGQVVDIAQGPTNWQFEGRTKNFAASRIMGLMAINFGGMRLPLVSFDPHTTAERFEHDFGRRLQAAMVLGTNLSAVDSYQEANAQASCFSAAYMGRIGRKYSTAHVGSEQAPFSCYHGVQITPGGTGGVTDPNSRASNAAVNIFGGDYSNTVLAQYEGPGAKGPRLNYTTVEAGTHKHMALLFPGEYLDPRRRR